MFPIFECIQYHNNNNKTITNKEVNNSMFFYYTMRSVSESNPPNPTCYEQQYDTCGRQLVNHVKQLLFMVLEENDSNNDNIIDTSNNNNEYYYTTTNTIISLLQQQTIIVQRYGLLRQNQILGQQIITSYLQQLQQQQGVAVVVDGSKSKSSSASFKNTITATTTTFDVQLLMMAILQIMNVQQQQQQQATAFINSIYYNAILTAACDFITTVCQYLIQQQRNNSTTAIGATTNITEQSHITQNVCFLAEYEIMASNAKTILVNITKFLQQQYDNSNNNDNDNNNYNDNTTDPKDDDDDDDDESMVVQNTIIVACYNTASAIISLLGTKLSSSRTNSSSKNTSTTTIQVIHQLQQLAWYNLLQCSNSNTNNNYSHDENILTSCNTAATASLQKAAITMITTLPLAGVAMINNNNATTSVSSTGNNILHSNTGSAISTTTITVIDVWNQTLYDVSTTLLHIIRYVIPLSSIMNQQTKRIGTQSLCHVSPFIQQMVFEKYIVNQMQSEQDENKKVHMFLHIVASLVHIIIELFTKKGSLGVANIQQQQCIGLHEIPIDILLTLIDNMITITSSSENKLYATKKRLRNERIVNGLLSPNSIASHIAIPIRLLGHDLFNTIVFSLRSCNLLPHVRQIYKIVYYSINNASSTLVRQIVDPTTYLQMDYKQIGERWLHTSIHVRIASIQSFIYIIQTFGIDIVQQQQSSSSSIHQSTTSSYSNNNNSSNKNNNNHYVDASISMICCTMMDELLPSASTSTSSASASASSLSWGTMTDHAKLVTTMSSCLTTCLYCGGAFLSLPIRGIIDMICRTALYAITHHQSVTIYSEVKVSILQLGIAALTTPWQDGASSTISTDLVSVSQQLLQDPHDTVVSTATTVLNICHSLQCSRIPPLHVITRRSENNSNHYSTLSSTITVASIEEKLHTTRKEMEDAQRIRNNNSSAVSTTTEQNSKMKKIKINVDEGVVEVEPKPRPLDTAATTSIQTISNTDATTTTSNLLRDDTVSLHQQNDARTMEQLPAIPTVDPRPDDAVVVETKHTISTNRITDNQINDDGDYDEMNHFPTIVDCEPDDDDI